MITPGAQWCATNPVPRTWRTQSTRSGAHARDALFFETYKDQVNIVHVRDGADSADRVVHAGRWGEAIEIAPTTSLGDRGSADEVVMEQREPSGGG
jgi:hypothetical protein